MVKKMGSLLVGFVLLAAGGVLIYWGYHEAESFGEKINSAFTGSPSNRVLVFYISGAVCGLLGLIMAFRK